MKTIMLILFQSLFVLGHGTGTDVLIKMAPPKFSAGPIQIKLDLHHHFLNKNLTDQDLVAHSGRLLSAVIYDPALEEFRFVTPEFKKGKWVLNFELTRNGFYFLWIMGQLKFDHIEFTSSHRFLVQGGKAENKGGENITGSLEFKSAEGDHIGVQTLGEKTCKPGSPLDLKFHVTLADGKSPQDVSIIEKVLTKTPGSTHLHIHKKGGQNSSPDILTISDGLPSVDIYRLWLVLELDGRRIIAPFAIPCQNSQKSL